MKNIEDRHFQVLLFLGQFLIHFEEAGDDVGFEDRLGESFMSQ